MSWMSRSFRPSLILAGTFSASALATLAHPYKPLRCDAQSIYSSPRHPQARTRNRSLKDRALDPVLRKNVLKGGFIGLVSGLAVSFFSKPLTVFIGLLILANQYLESHGVHLIPYARIRRHLMQVNVQEAIQENMAFNVSFGITFALAGWGSF